MERKNIKSRWTGLLVSGLLAAALYGCGQGGGEGSPDIGAAQSVAGGDSHTDPDSSDISSSSGVDLTQSIAPLLPADISDLADSHYTGSTDIALVNDVVLSIGLRHVLYGTTATFKSSSFLANQNSHELLTRQLIQTIKQRFLDSNHTTSTMLVCQQGGSLLVGASIENAGVTQTTVSFDACSEQDVVRQGVITLDIPSIAIQSPAELDNHTLAYWMTFNQLTYASGYDFTTLNGTEFYTGPLGCPIASTRNMTLDNGITQVLVENLDVQFETGSTCENRYLSPRSVNGRIYDSRQGFVDITTETEFNFSPIALSDATDFPIIPDSGGTLRVSDVNSIEVATLEFNRASFVDVHDPGETTYALLSRSYFSRRFTDHVPFGENDIRKGALIDVVDNDRDDVPNALERVNGLDPDRDLTTFDQGFRLLRLLPVDINNISDLSTNLILNLTAKPLPVRDISLETRLSVSGDTNYPGTVFLRYDLSQPATVFLDVQPEHSECEVGEQEVECTLQAFQDDNGNWNYPVIALRIDEDDREGLAFDVVATFDNGFDSFGIDNGKKIELSESNYTVRSTEFSDIDVILPDTITVHAADDFLTDLELPPLFPTFDIVNQVEPPSLPIPEAVDKKYRLSLHLVNRTSTPATGVQVLTRFPSSVTVHRASPECEIFAFLGDPEVNCAVSILRDSSPVTFEYVNDLDPTRHYRECG